MKELNFNPLVSVIIVNLNRKEDLRECINSILKQDYPNIEIIVVDNFSIDGSPEMVANEVPQARLIRLDRNLGCPGGRNVGILNARGEILCFIDNDAIAEPNIISKICALLIEKPCVSAVVPMTINQTTGLPRSIGKFMNNEIIPRYIPFLYGTCAIRKRVFEEVGLYPPDYMYGAEETDLSYRMINNGLYIYYLPDARVYHKVSQSERNKRWQYRHQLKNDLITFWKHAPRSIVLIGSVWKICSHFIYGLKNRLILDFFVIIGELLFKFPRYYLNSKPIKKEAFLLSIYLRNNIIKELDDNILACLKKVNTFRILKEFLESIKK